MQDQPTTIALARRLLLWASICATVTLAACSTLTPASPEDQVRLRATERWKHMVAKDFDKAYGYSTQAFRGVVPEKDYRGRFGAAVVWVGAEVVRVNCPEPAKCTAVVKLDYITIANRKANDPYSVHFDETWLLEDGQWWIFQNLKGD